MEKNKRNCLIAIVVINLIGIILLSLTTTIEVKGGDTFTDIFALVGASFVTMIATFVFIKIYND